MALEQLGCKCVFASELQQDLRTLYENNFGMKCAGDIFGQWNLALLMITKAQHLTSSNGNSCVAKKVNWGKI